MSDDVFIDYEIPYLSEDKSSESEITGVREFLWHTLSCNFIFKIAVFVSASAETETNSSEEAKFWSDENGCDRRRRTNKKAKAWRVNMRVTVKVTLPAWILTLANEKQQLPKKEDANSGGQNQKRDVDNVEYTNLKNNYKGASSGKKASRASYDSDTEYGNKKQVCSKVEVYSGGMTQKREEEAGSKHNKERYISDSRGKKIARNSVDR
ncbi:hypothetical protein F2Q70_00045285 [Brassica cretica]|uniref:Uncharacterized protein n=1 Tax=Brassica cretica TaxID=69181 RepID=A0A8S9KBU1_BRACR|nr:hypothetical protein F2Q70_00045285 [Brassica cretica]